ncbi:Melanoma-associated antigen D4 [Myotis brandtii]|uniref:Melanoma-associated antigen D4 n=1 Tax=Myotis brandtii TaxID=109478 RepID=S7MSS5_MYOBR|nr:Melanoma-associated antigen D4 [Myotis brandtii]
MAEGSSPMESECCNVEDMEDGLEEVREYEMFDGNEYEEFGAFGGYGTFTSFDIHLLRAFGSLGTSLRVLANEPWELDHPMLARTLVDAFRADPEPAPNEEDDQSGNAGRGDSNRAARTAARAAARAAAAAARALYNQVVTSRPMATDQASREDTQPMASSPHSSQMPGNSEMAASGAPATSSQPQPGSQAREAASSRAPCASEVDATQPKKPFLGQNDGFDFTQPAGVSGIAFPRPKRPAPAPEPAPEGPSAQAASAGEGAATRPKTAKSGKALAKTRWVEPQNVVAAAAAKAKMATSAPEPEGAAATAQNNRDEPWARMGGKRTKKSKHLDDEYESSEEEREPPVVPPTWRASQPPLTVRAQMAPRAQMGPRPPMAVRPQVPSRHILCLPPRNVALLQDRANKLVKYLMIKDYKKIPIKRSDMMKDVIREYDEHFPEIIERATYTLEKKFGIHLKEIDKEEHLYILTCTRDSSARLLGKTKDTPRLSLLLVILGVIFMNGNRVSEGELPDPQLGGCPLSHLRVLNSCTSSALAAVLWEALRKMGLRPGYLEYKKVPNSSPPEYEFFWGLRARYETSKMRVLRFIAQYQNRDPRDWKAHFLEAVDDAFKTMDADMAEEHARAQMRARMNIGDEALIGRWSWDDVQVELLTWDEDGDFGDAWARIPFAFWARYHQYILNSNRANRRTTWRAGVSSGNIGAANASLIDGPSTSSTIRSRNAARTTANFFSWIQ